MSKASSHIEREHYTLRLFATLAASLVILIGVVRWWPLPADDPDPRIYSTRGQDVIAMEEIVPTRQRQQAPPPPAPLPPVVVDDDVVLDDFELELTDSIQLTDAAGVDAEAAPGEDDGMPTTLASVTVGPRVVRIVEPEYTREARRKNIRAEAEIEVLVNARGQVDDARIVERYLLKGDEENRESVDEIGYGVEESMLAAARRWMFRPAREQGRPVTSYMVVTMAVGRE